MSRVDSGFSSLDFLLQGGLPEDPNVVICGAATDLALLSRRLLWHRLQAGDACVYGTLSQTRREVLDELREQDYDVTPFLRDGRLQVLDYLSLYNPVAATVLPKLAVHLAMQKTPMDPNRLFKPFARAFWRVQDQHPTRRFLAILDSIDQIIALAGLPATLAFKQLVDDLLQDTNSLGIVLLCPDALPLEQLDAVRNAASLFIELHRDPKGLPKIRITKDLHARWTALF